MAMTEIRDVKTIVSSPERVIDGVRVKVYSVDEVEGMRGELAIARGLLVRWMSDKKHHLTGDTTAFLRASQPVQDEVG